MGSPDDSSEDSTKPGSRRAVLSSGHGTTVVATGEGLNVLKLRMPIVMVGSLIAMSISLSGVWWKLVGHAEAKTIHLDERAVIEGGGVAYKNDIRDIQYHFERRLRKMLQGTTVTCRVKKAGQMESECTLSVADVE
jgi:hypothetical protein